MTPLLALLSLGYNSISLQSGTVMLISIFHIRMQDGTS